MGSEMCIRDSVSCIYGIGAVETYSQMVVTVKSGAQIDPSDLLRKFVELQYRRNDGNFHRGTFRVRGDTIEIFPAHYEDRAWRISLFGDEVEAIHEFDPLNGDKAGELETVRVYANSHYVTPNRPCNSRSSVSVRNCRHGFRSWRPRTGSSRHSVSTNALPSISK